MNKFNRSLQLFHTENYKTIFKEIRARADINIIKNIL